MFVCACELYYFYKFPINLSEGKGDHVYGENPICFQKVLPVIHNGLSKISRGVAP